MSILDYRAKRITQETEDLNKYAGNVILVVNTASKCGFTKQYTALEKIYNEYIDQGFTILGFPCNQFGHQEKGQDSEIADFCSLNFGVTFPLFSKIEVNGKGTHPFYAALKERAPGIMNSKSIKWNFTKFLISRDQQRITRYSSQTKPEALKKFIEEELARKS